MSKYLVLSMKPYDFTNQEGKRFAGVKLSYINKKPSSRDKEEGHTPFIVSITDKEIIKEFQGKVPAIYDMEFEQVTGKNNKPEIILIEVQYIAPVDITSLF